MWSYASLLATQTTTTQLEALAHGRALEMNTKKRTALLSAAIQMDWQQTMLNGGPPCFFLCDDGRFCGRHERWLGHADDHGYVSLAALLRKIIGDCK